MEFDWVCMSSILFLSANGTAVVAKNKFRLSTARLFQLQTPPETTGAINTVYNNAHLSIK